MPPAEEEPPVENEPAGGSTPVDRPLTISSQELLRGQRELWIEHDGEIYRLRLTSRGKLYLTK